MTLRYVPYSSKITEDWSGLDPDKNILAVV